MVSRKTVPAPTVMPKGEKMFVPSPSKAIHLRNEVNRLERPSMGHFFSRRITAKPYWSFDGDADTKSQP
jgi:hypothetical protein